MAAFKISNQSENLGYASENSQRQYKHILYLYTEFEVNGIKHAKHAKVRFYKQGGSKQMTGTGAI